MLKSMRGAGQVPALVATAAGAGAAIAANPTEEGAKTAAGEIVIDAICAVMGGCADAE